VALFVFADFEAAEPVDVPEDLPPVAAFADRELVAAGFFAAGFFAVAFVAAFVAAFVETFALDEADVEAVLLRLPALERAAAAFDFDAEGRALAVEAAGAVPRTTSDWPGKISGRRSRLSSWSFFVVVPYRFAIPESVSPRRTTCITTDDPLRRDDDAADEP